MPVSDYTPSVSEVASFLRARTRDRSGVETGTFTSSTRPTDDQVTELVDSAAGTVSLAIGDDIPAVLFKEAKDVVCYLVVCLIELSYFPEQVAGDRSAYNQYKDLYDEAIGTRQKPGGLVIAVQQSLEDLTVDSAGHSKTKASFPKALRWNW